MRDSQRIVAEPGGVLEMDPQCTIHQRFNWTNKSQPTSWLNKLPLSWSLMIYGGRACRCCSAETRASAKEYPISEWGLAGVSGSESCWCYRSCPASITIISKHLQWSACYLSRQWVQNTGQLWAMGFSNIPGLIWATTGNHTRAPANKSVQPKNHKGLASFTVTGACRGARTQAARRTVFFLRKKHPAHLQDGWLFW